MFNPDVPDRYENEQTAYEEWAGFYKDNSAIKEDVSERDAEEYLDNIFFEEHEGE
jgi:hypothetical protein